MGVIIAIADLYWTYTSYPDSLWLTLGAIIFIADLVWLALDFNLMRESNKPIHPEKKVSNNERPSMSK
jgi:hypothetical protein